MIQLAIICTYLLLLLILGGAANRVFRGTSRDYMLASHSIGPILLLMSLFGTTMTAFALVGSTGEAYKEGVGVYGMLASSSGIIHPLCFFLIGTKLWAFGRRHGYTTQIQFFRDRLESDGIGLLLFPLLVGMVIPYILIGIVAAGAVINGVTEGAFRDYFAAYDYGVPPWLGSLVICGAVLVYVFMGGMRGTAWANAFQTLVFMTLGVVTFAILAQKLGGLQTASQLVLEKNPSKLIREVHPRDQEKYEESYRRWEILAEYNFAKKLAGGELLSLSQRADAHAAFPGSVPNWQARAEAEYANLHGLIDLTIAERNEARLEQDDRERPADGEESFPMWSSRILSHAELMRLPRPRGIDGYASRRQYAELIGHPHDLIDPNDPSLGRKWTLKKAAGIYRAAKWAPEPLHEMDKLIFFTYLLIPLSAGMFPHLFQHWLTAKNAESFKLPIVVHPIFILIVWAPCVLLGVWATSAEVNGQPLFAPHFPPNAVLAVMVGRLTTPILAGLLTAGILAAIMSSLDSQFLCLGSIFTHDVVLHYSGKRRFSESQVVLLARSFVVAVVVVTYLLSLAETRRVFTLGIWCFSGFASLFPLVFAAIYWPRLTKAGALASVLAASAAWLILFHLSGYGLDPNFSFLGMMPVATIFACATFALVAVSLVTPQPSRATLQKFFSERALMEIGK